MRLMTDTYDDGDITMADEQESGEHDVLIRCTQGEVAKFSAKVRYNSLFISKSYFPSLYHLRSITWPTCALHETTFRPTYLLTPLALTPRFPHPDSSSSTQNTALSSNPP